MFLFFFNDTATTEIYTLSLHDALPISGGNSSVDRLLHVGDVIPGRPAGCNRTAARELLAEPVVREDAADRVHDRSEEHTSELQSQSNLVCRLLLEKKKNQLHDSSTHTY